MKRLIQVSYLGKPGFHGLYLKDLVSDDHVRKHGYGFTSELDVAQRFDTDEAAEPVVDAVAKHMGWPQHRLQIVTDIGESPTRVIEPIRKTFTRAELERAATAFVQTHGAGEELEWRWERAGMFTAFVAELFEEAT